MHTVVAVTKVIAMLSVCVALAWLSTTQRGEFDLTRQQSHSLSDASISLLKNFDEPIRIEAFLSPSHPWRQQVSNLVGRYRRVVPSIKFSIVDPASAPERVRESQIKDGEILISSASRVERAASYDEHALSSALARLTRSGESWIVFVSGHGERSSRRQANHDVSDWARSLEQRGLKVQEIDINSIAIPDNTRVLVIASPQRDFLPGETQKVVDFINAGGQLLWLVEPQLPRELTRLAKALGFEQLPGTLVDPLSVAHGIDNPAIVVVSKYQAHAPLNGFSYASVLPYASAVHDRAVEDWQAKRLILSSDKAWSETAELAGNVAFDEGIDYPGPLPLALAFERQRGAATQRMVVIGDGDFLANAYLQNSGNQDLGVRLVEWLSQESVLLDIESRFGQDNSLVLKEWQQATIGFLFLIGLPLAFAITGVVVWWRRRRA